MARKNVKVCAKAQEKKNYHLDSKDWNPCFREKTKKQKKTNQSKKNLQTHGKYQSFRRGKETTCQQYKAYGVFSLLIPLVTKIKSGTFTGEF